MTLEQINKTETLLDQDYMWNKQHPLSSKGLVLSKGDDIWFLSINGEITHNPHKNIKS